MEHGFGMFLSFSADIWLGTNNIYREIGELHSSVYFLGGVACQGC
jgi:hypothetical protein